MPLFKRAFMVVRRAEGKEWLDIDTLAPTPAGALRMAEKSTEKIPEWLAANPVVRTCKVRIEEIEEA